MKGLAMLRKIACWMMVFAYPASLLAADSGAAMLHTRGTTWLNGIQCCDPGGLPG